MRHVWGLKRNTKTTPLRRVALLSLLRTKPQKLIVRINRRPPGKTFSQEKGLEGNGQSTAVPRHSQETGFRLQRHSIPVVDQPINHKDVLPGRHLLDDGLVPAAQKDPLSYLRDVFTRLPTMNNEDDLDALTPSLFMSISIIIPVSTDRRSRCLMAQKPGLPERWITDFSL